MSDRKRGGWGYASYDVDNPDDERITYTRYEDSGKVNKYTDNGDGGHSHSFWESKDDYNSGEEPKQYREESDRSKNPSQEEIEEGSGCFLTTACLENYKENFDDKCYELELLRWFRDNYVTKEDIKHYYEIAPLIVKSINKLKQKSIAYDYIYENIVLYCIEQIENFNFLEAYDRYKESVLKLEKSFVNN